MQCHARVECQAERAKGQRKGRGEGRAGWHRAVASDCSRLRPCLWHRLPRVAPTRSRSADVLFSAAMQMLPGLSEILMLTLYNLDIGCCFGDACFYAPPSLCFCRITSAGIGEPRYIFMPGNASAAGEKRRKEVKRNTPHLFVKRKEICKLKILAGRFSQNVL